MDDQYLVKLEEAAKLADSNNPYERFDGQMALNQLLDCGSVLELVEIARNALAEKENKIRLEKEADWLAGRLVDLCRHRYEPDCRVLYDPEVASKKLFREAAQCQTR